MLVLTRRPGESVVIADNIKITVVSVGPGRVKIGIEAPAHVRVDRQEIHDKIQGEHELGSDVLSAVASARLSGTGNTLTLSSGDTNSCLPVAEPVVSAGQPVSSIHTPPPAAINRLKRSLPRKPR